MGGTKSMLLIHAAMAHATAAPRRPPSPLNITVVNLRPYNMSADISQKDTADVAGDAFFYLADRAILPYRCRRDPQSFLCRGFKILTNPSDVYTEQIVEVDGTFGGCPDGNATCSNYADCNPRTNSSGGIEWFCGCREQHPWELGSVDDGPCNVTGKVSIGSRYCFDGEHSHHPHLPPPMPCHVCADGCHDISSQWKSLIGYQTRGIWYSTAREGDCRNASAACAWRLVATPKTINATCANDHLHHAIEAHAKANAASGAADDDGASCFDKCTPASDRQSDCYITCLVQTVSGRNPLSVNTTVTKAMSAEELARPLQTALSKDDPAEGGCPALPPYVPPKSEGVYK